MASIDKRPSGKYLARWREYPGGPQRTKTFARKVDAERFLVDVQHRLLSGTYVDPGVSRTTLDAYAEVHLARQPWRASTGEVAARALTHAGRELGRRPLGSIRKGDVQAFVSGLELAPSTVATTFQHLNTLLEAAVDDGLIARNPARGVKLPGRAGGEVVPASSDPRCRRRAASGRGLGPHSRPGAVARAVGPCRPAVDHSIRPRRVWAAQEQEQQPHYPCVDVRTR
jgi:hypothetical protein